MNLSTRNLALRFISALALSAIVTMASAAEKIDLERTKPVPATEQIPIADFFRPRLLQQPKLNPAGTHIGALISAGSDQYQLLVYDLKTQKPETLGGAGDKDVYDFNWLNDERLIFGFSSRKLYGMGLFAANVGRLATSYPLLQYYGANIIAIKLQ